MGVKGDLPWQIVPPLSEVLFNTCSFEKQMIEIIHPYSCENDDSHTYQKIKVIYFGETVNGIPNGFGKIKFAHSTDRTLSFKGWAFLVDGQIHGGPAFFISETGHRRIFSSMIKGRPFGLGKQYYREARQAKCKIME